MIIDLHIHSKTCSDGNLPVEAIIEEAKSRNVEVISITDHDSIGCQKLAMTLAQKKGIRYVCGVELNITFSYPTFCDGKTISLDLLGYNFDINDRVLHEKLEEISRHREERAAKILEKLNTEFEKDGLRKFTEKDLTAIQLSTDGVLGRPHIADYLVKKGIVSDRKQAFKKYLVKCDVPKYPLYLEEASSLLRNAGGIVVLAHPNDPYGTSLAKLTNSLQEQTRIIEDSMLNYIDGIECWHSRNNPETTIHYMNFSKKHNLKITGGSDCHQNPIIMGTILVPDFVVEQFLK